MTVNIILLNWRSADWAGQCLAGLSRSDATDIRVVLVNNFSTQADLEAIRSVKRTHEARLEIHLVELPGNMGYAGGNNEGIRYVIGNGWAGHFLIVNPDVSFQPDTIDRMLEALNGDVGIVGVRTLDSHGRILYDAMQLRGFGCTNVIVQQKGTVSTDFVQGSCMLVDRTVVERVGLLDERFFLYWEEVDYSLRTRDAGFRIVAVTSASVTRGTNQDSRKPGAFYYSIRNARLLKAKHPERFRTYQYMRYVFATILVTFKLANRPRLFVETLEACLSGLVDSWRGKYYSRADPGASDSPTPSTGQSHR